MSDFLVELRGRASRLQHAIVFPEGEDPRVQRAAVTAVRERLFRPVLLGNTERIEAALDGLGSRAGEVRVVDPSSQERIEACAERLRTLAAERGSRVDDAWAADPLFQAAGMVVAGEVAGSVAGAVRTTAEVARAALKGVGLSPDVDRLSSAFFMVFRPDHPVGPRVLSFADAGVNPAPTPEQLAAIAGQAADAHRSATGEEPRVAFLSYSTKGSADGPGVDAVRQALQRFRVIRPDVVADGELQGDAALVPEVAERKAPGSPVAGAANVLVFPDLSSANLAYKLVQHLGGAVALGPILLGPRRPFNDLSRGATDGDIVDVACVTASMAVEEAR